MEGMHENDVEHALTAIEIYTLERGDVIRFRDTLWEVTHIAERGDVNKLQFELCECELRGDLDAFGNISAVPTEDGKVIYAFATQLIGKAY